MCIQILVILISLCFNEHKFIHFCFKTVIDFFKFKSNIINCGLGSSVGIVTGYWLDGPGSNTGGGENFRTCPYRH